MASQKELEKQEVFNWTILFILITSTIILGISRDGIPSLFPFMQQEFSLTRAQIGLFSSFFFASSTLVAVFSGRIVDLLGPRGAMMLGASSVGFFMVLFSIIPQFNGILILSFLMGLGVSVITPAASKGVMEWFPTRTRGTAMGLVQSGIGVGSFLAASTLPVLSEVFRWRTAIIFPGLLALLLCLFFYHFYVSPGMGRDEKRNNLPFLHVLKTLLRDRYFILLSLLGLVFGMAFGATNSHYTLYLHQDHGLSRVVAGWGFGILHIGAIIGRTGWGIVSDTLLKGDRRKGLLLIGLSITFFSLLLGLVIKDSASLPILIGISFFMGLVALGFFGLYVTAIGEQVGSAFMGTAMGICLTFFRFGLFISPPVFGWIADLQGHYARSWVLQGVIVLLAILLFYYLSMHSAREEDCKS